MLETSTDTLKKLNEILSSVIADYTISDVPLGTFLSGGIDSPTCHINRFTIRA